jgi:hypothetical protein
MESSGAGAAYPDGVGRAVWEHSGCLGRASGADQAEPGRDKSADQERAAAPVTQAWDESAANALLSRVEAGQLGAPMADQPARVVLPAVVAQWAPLVRGPWWAALVRHEAEWEHPEPMKFQPRQAPGQALRDVLVLAAISVAAVERA